jgi:hypothetical protein
VGSAGHEEVLKLTDLKEVFEDEDKDEVAGEAISEEEREDGSAGTGEPEGLLKTTDARGDVDSDDDADHPKEKKRKRKQEKDVLAGKKKKGRNQVEADPSFFSGL